MSLFIPPPPLPSPPLPLFSLHGTRTSNPLTKEQPHDRVNSNSCSAYNNTLN